MEPVMADALDDARTYFAQMEQSWLAARVQHAQIRARGDELAAQLRAMSPADHADEKATEAIFRGMETSIADAQRSMRIERETYQELLRAERAYKELELSWFSTALCSFQARRRAVPSSLEAPRG
jgi:hypothetical protein